MEPYCVVATCNSPSFASFYTEERKKSDCNKVLMIVEFQNLLFLHKGLTVESQKLRWIFNIEIEIEIETTSNSPSFALSYTEERKKPDDCNKVLTIVEFQN